MKRIKDFLGRFQAVRGPEYKSSLRQYGEMLWLFLRRHLSPTEYYLYGLGRRGAQASRLREYIVTAWAVRELRPRLNSRLWEPVLRNKILFHQHCARHQLPRPEFYGLFQPQFGYTAAGAPLCTGADLEKLVESMTGQAIIVKPVDGLKGASIFRLVVARGGGFLDPQGAWHDCQQVAAAMSRGNGFLLEECLENHPMLGAYNFSSLNTCRVVTFVNRAGRCRVLFATARFGRAGSVTDNWSGGGVAVGIDLNTGALGRGLVLPQFGGGWRDSHPDSGLTFVGKALPHWPQVMDLVQRAALTLPWCHAIGWDVAITSAGPVLVEGNGQWNPSLGQAFTGGLLTEELRRDLAELGLKFPA